jgi:ssDNA-binding Zn-finger/Zn-ribbon topoisomerase 1
MRECSTCGRGMVLTDHPSGFRFWRCPTPTCFNVRAYKPDAKGRSRERSKQSRGEILRERRDMRAMQMQIEHDRE